MLFSQNETSACPQVKKCLSDHKDFLLKYVKMSHVHVIQRGRFCFIFQSNLIK